MSNLFWLSEEQMARLRPFFPKSHGKPRVDDKRVLSEIKFINRNDLRWSVAPREYGPAQTFYNPWHDGAIWGGPFHGWVGGRGRGSQVHHDPSRDIAIAMPCRVKDTTYLKAHRTASSLQLKRGGGRLIGRSLKGQDLIRGIKYPENGRDEHKAACRH